VASANQSIHELPSRSARPFKTAPACLDAYMRTCLSAYPCPPTCPPAHSLTEARWERLKRQGEGAQQQLMRCILTLPSGGGMAALPFWPQALEALLKAGAKQLGPAGSTAAGGRNQSGAWAGGWVGCWGRVWWVARTAKEVEACCLPAEAGDRQCD